MELDCDISIDYLPGKDHIAGPSTSFAAPIVNDISSNLLMEASKATPPDIKDALSACFPAMRMALTQTERTPVISINNGNPSIALDLTILIAPQQKTPNDAASHQRGVMLDGR